MEHLFGRRLKRGKVDVEQGTRWIDYPYHNDTKAAALKGIQPLDQSISGHQTNVRALAESVGASHLGLSIGIHRDLALEYIVGQVVFPAFLAPLCAN